jgi:hypothetical protein
MSRQSKVSYSGKPEHSICGKSFLKMESCFRIRKVLVSVIFVVRARNSAVKPKVATGGINMQTNQNSEVEREIRALEHEWDEAQLRHDMTALDRTWLTTLLR